MIHTYNSKDLDKMTARQLQVLKDELFDSYLTVVNKLNKYYIKVGS